MKSNYVIITLWAYAIITSTVSGETQVNRKLLTGSLKLGRLYYLNNQLKAGNFRYEYDFRNGKAGGADSSVRQAGALWGATLVHSEMPSDETDRLIRRGLRFFHKHTTTLESGAKLVIYPGESEGRTGTVSLLSLALVDYLRTKPKLSDREMNVYKGMLDGYVKFLISIRTKDGSFNSTYSTSGKGLEKPSPYFDGETLLLLVKVCKYMNREDLKAMIQTSAEAMYKEYVVAALKKDPDSSVCKGFYQWGTMAFYEIYTSGWGDQVKPYGGRILKLAEWMIKTHKVLKKRKNTAYAYEGLIHAYDVARREKNKRAMTAIGNVIDEGLFKISTWQVGSPIANSYIKSQGTLLDRSKGGILNSAREPNLRIDVTQHQMHAVILARRLIYRADSKKGN